MTHSILRQRRWGPKLVDYAALKKDITREASAMGFQQIGVTDLDLSAHAPHVRDWLAKGFNGEMGYLERNLEKRLDPMALESFTCRVISARMDYLISDPDPQQVLNNAELGYVSRYALGRDYHKILRRRLARLGKWINTRVAEFDHQFRAFTDSAPVLEKALGEKAGLGWIGKHSLLLNADAGSWFFIGEIFTNLPLPADQVDVEDSCGNCRACMTVCPTQAIVAPQQLDARRCISYLTIEHKSAIPEDLRALMGNRIYGCDDCQIFCPWNRYASDTDETDFTPRHSLQAPDLLTLFNWSEQEFERNTEGSAIRRISYEQWQRNVAIALGNGPANPAVIGALQARRDQASAMVAEHIDWALARLQQQSGIIASESLNPV